MTTRQLTLKRDVKFLTRIKDLRKIAKWSIFLMHDDLYKFKNELYGDINLFNEQTEMEFEINLCTSMVLIAQSFKGIYRFIPHYTFLTKEALLTMWKDRKGIELKRQRKLERIAILLDKNERYQEAYVIRIIVKPYLKELNKKWTNMTAQEKFKSLFS